MEPLTVRWNAILVLTLIIHQNHTTCVARIHFFFGTFNQMIMPLDDYHSAVVCIKVVCTSGPMIEKL